MLQSRRGFLIGAGSLLTAAFVTEAQAFVRQAAKPLLAEQVKAQHTLYWYLPKGSNAPLLCLDGSPFIVPPPPPWRDFLQDMCRRLYARQCRPEHIEDWRRYYDVELDQLEQPVDPAVWQLEQDIWLSPQARAYRLLRGIHFGPELDRSYGGTGGFQRPHVQFSTELIGGDRFRRRIAASDLVALSLLQARLIELGRPIKIVEGANYIDQRRQRA
jgi:hypothetical protein